MADVSPSLRSQLALFFRSRYVSSSNSFFPRSLEFCWGSTTLWTWYWRMWQSTRTPRREGGSPNSIKYSCMVRLSYCLEIKFPFIYLLIKQYLQTVLSGYFSISSKVVKLKASKHSILTSDCFRVEYNDDGTRRRGADRTINFVTRRT